MRKYQFTNKLMFAIVMRDPTACRGLIERLFPGKKVKTIYFPGQDGRSREVKGESMREAVAEVEKTMINGLESRSVRLDVLFEEDNTLYDIEMQIDREEEIAKRSRYYHTSMARQGLKKGQPYRMLKSNYVIFVCCYDAFDMDAPIYRFEMFDNNLQLKLGDGSSTIILNTKCSKEKIPQELMAFYDFVDTGRVDASDTFVKYLDTRVEEANNDEEVDRIMTLEEEMIVRYDSGLQKGRAEGATLKQREIAQNLKNAGIPIPVIAETTGLTQEEVEML
ncbi:MAG: Rpn family recombination-promoting nuclease/putative transposase [Clostridia bacterium]